MPKPLASSAAIDAVIARVASAVLELLGNGVPRSRRAIVAALANRHPADVKRAIARLSVLRQLELKGSKYTLPAAETGLNHVAGLEE